MMLSGQRGAAALIIIVVIAVLLLVGIGIYLITQGDDNGSDTAASDTEIRVKGQGATVVISPSEGEVISGMVTVEVEDAPEGTNLAFFAITGENMADISETGPNLDGDENSSDGWSVRFDTAEYENGHYEISGLAMSGPDDNPLGIATAQVTIQN